MSLNWWTNIFSTYIHTHNTQVRGPWYCLRKWTWFPKFKSWMRLFTFHIALIPLGKVWIQLFSFQLWVNSRVDWTLQPWYGYWSKSWKTVNSNLLNSVWNWPCIAFWSWWGVGKYLFTSVNNLNLSIYKVGVWVFLNVSVCVLCVCVSVCLSVCNIYIYKVRIA